MAVLRGAAGGSSGRRQRCRRRQVGGAGGLVLLGGGACGCAAAVRSGKAGRLWALCRWGRAGAGAWSSWAAVCCWRGHLVRRWRGLSFPVQVVGAISGHCVQRSPGTFQLFPGQPPTTPSACRSADPAGRAGGRREGKAKEKGQGGGAWCAAALAFCLRWRCDLLRRVRPGAYRGRRGSAPRSGAGLLALALIRAQRFQLATFQHGTACAGGAPSGAFFAVCRRGQILHFTG